MLSKIFKDDGGMVISAEALSLMLVFLGIAVAVTGIMVDEILTADTVIQKGLENVHGGGF